MSNLDNAMRSLTRVCVDADRGPLMEDVLLSVAADLTRAVEALGYPTLQVVLGDDVPLAETQAALLGVARAVAARYGECLAKSERKIRATDPLLGGSVPSTCAGRHQGGSR
ncbi:hypothetical protein QU668_04025 [Schaalia sp. HMT-877]|nr:hypothetical protein QU668_04025 [Schaalia sp. HMT-877]